MALPGGVTMHADVVYAVKSGFRPLTMDIYTPSTPGPHPLILYVHGGGWAAGNKRGNEAAGQDGARMLARLAAKGFVVAATSYRLAGEAKFPAPVEDVNDALRWLKTNAAHYGGDPSRSALWGASAGGQIMALAALDCQARSLDPRGPVEPSTCVNAVVDWYGLADFSTIVSDGAAGNWGKPGGVDVTYLGCSTAPCPADVMRRASPMSYAKAAPPTLFVHGDADTVVPIVQSRNLQAALERAGTRTEFKLVPGANHLFRGVSPALVDDAVETTFAFFVRELKPGR
jgi:acetyl esterase/lipase